MGRARQHWPLCALWRIRGADGAMALARTAESEAVRILKTRAARLSYAAAGSLVSETNTSSRSASRVDTSTMA